MYINKEIVRMQTKTDRKATSHVAFFNAVNEVKTNPDEYTTLTYVQVATKLTEKLGMHVAETRIKEILSLAGYARPSIPRSKVGMGTKIPRVRDLCRAIRRTFVNAGFQEQDIDPYIIKWADVNSRED